jgi:acetyltransferase-like isoleucine patch superfamily enzyme
VSSRRRPRLLALAVVALLPNVLKQSIYRLFFGYRIGRNVRIGVVLLDADECSIDDDVQIGHLNVFIEVKRLVIGDHARIGHLNIVRGGDEVTIGRYAEILRKNEINSIPDPETLAPVDQRLRIGNGAVVTTGHKIDFTDRVDIGDRAIIGGRNSSIWTHNRQRTAPVSIGARTYVGSEIRMAPGSSLPAYAVVGIGAVVVDQICAERQLIAGVPAKPVKELDDEALYFTERKTRNDLPDDL